MSNEAALPLEDSAPGAEREKGPEPANTGDFSSSLRCSSPLLFSIATVLLLYGGWLNHDQSSLTAESGAGYALGIVGGVLMLLLLLYPLRKKLPSMRRLGPVKYWFRAHMILGVAGPVCIVFHTNYELGSLNSNVALFCMLLVAGSGLVGRYFYKKIHHGLYGGKATLRELAQAALISKGQLNDSLHLTPRLQQRLQKYEALAGNPPQSLLGSALHVLKFTCLTRWNHFLLRRFLKHSLAHEGQLAHWSRRELQSHCREAGRHLRIYMATLRKVTELGFYERLFSWWHVMHLPLFLMMLISGLIHVYAVHAY
ncbi:MAG: transcriptional regulator [Gammaproteobacteria bacterium]